MRFRIKPRTYSLAAIAASFIILYLGNSSSSRHCEQDRQRIDHLDITHHQSQNCSCSINYTRNHGFSGSLGPVKGIMKNTSSFNYLQEPTDKHLFNYIHNPNKTCFHKNGTEMEVFLMFIVLSAPSNFDQRDAIRSSFGKRETWPSTGSGQVVTVFLLASTSKPGLQEKIDTEYDNHGDIIQESFVDSYLNLTRKTIMGLKWVKNHCKHAQFVMKIDDDTSVIQRRLLTTLRSASHTNYTSGFFFKEPIVMRDKNNKFFMSKEYYPDDHFPPYPVGHGYVMTTDVSKVVFNVAVTIPLFPWEDVFFGMCLQKLNIQLNHDKDFFFWGNYTKLLTGNVNKISKKYVIATDIPPRDMVRFYQRFLIK